MAYRQLSKDEVDAMHAEISAAQEADRAKRAQHAADWIAGPAKATLTPATPARQSETSDDGAKRSGATKPGSLGTGMAQKAADSISERNAANQDAADEAKKYLR